MIKWLLIGFIIILILYFIKNKIRIKWKTFLKKGFSANRGKFGVYCYCGKQGSGKTLSVVEFLLNESGDRKIYSNIKSLRNVEYTYFNGLNELLSLSTESNSIIVYDELFTAITKNSKITTDILDFLSEMRKRKIIFITTAQEWLEIPITWRRYCRYQIDCKIFNIPFIPFSFLIKVFKDAENIKWSQLDNEYVCPLLETSISKCNKYVANSYNTLEDIKNNKNIELPQETENSQKLFDFVKKLKIFGSKRPKGVKNTFARTTSNSKRVVNGQKLMSGEVDVNFWTDIKNNEELYDNEDKE